MSGDDHNVHMSRVKRHLEHATRAAARIHGVDVPLHPRAPLSTAGSSSSSSPAQDPGGTAAAARSTGPRRLFGR